MKSSGIAAVTIGIQQELQDCFSGFLETLDGNVQINTLSFETGVADAMKSGSHYHMALTVCEVPEEEIAQLREKYPGIVILKHGCGSCVLGGTSDRYGNKVKPDFHVPAGYERLFFDAFKEEMEKKIF